MTLLQHPKENLSLHAHQAAEKTLLDAYNSGNMPHAWLFTGMKGVGKATLAYRFIRFLFANGDNKKVEEQGLFGGGMLPSVDFVSLALPEEHQVVDRIKNDTLFDMRVIESPNAEGKAEITVDAVREVNAFLSQTPSEYDWRIVLIDSVDNMNRNAANALLKTLEEPPKNTILILVSHSPGRLLPTIKSRCRQLSFYPLEDEDMQSIMQESLVDVSEKERAFAMELAQGCPGVALHYCQEGMVELYEKILHLLCESRSDKVPQIYKMAERIGQEKHKDEWRNSCLILQWFLSEVVNEGLSLGREEEFFTHERALKKHYLDHYSIDQIAVMWEKVNELLAQQEGLHMSKAAVWQRICDICAVA